MSTSLQIPKPCHEVWEGMTPDSNGRFCAACQKQVIDFTSYSDKELQAFFAGRKEKVCGRFEQSQLDRVLHSPLQSRQVWWPVVAFTAIATLLAPGKGRAGNVKAAVEMVPVKNIANEPVVSPSEDSLVISGYVRDSLGEPLLGASVYLVESKVGVVVRESGAYRLAVPLSMLKTANTLKVAFIGYVSDTVGFSATTREMTHDFVLKVSPDMVCKSFVAGGVISVRKRSLWYRITHPFCRY